MMQVWFLFVHGKNKIRLGSGLRSIAALKRPSDTTERETETRHTLKSVGAAARRRVLANVQYALKKVSCTERLTERFLPYNLSYIDY